MASKLIFRLLIGIILFLLVTQSVTQIKTTNVLTDLSSDVDNTIDDSLQLSQVDSTSNQIIKSNSFYSPTSVINTSGYAGSVATGHSNVFTTGVYTITQTDKGMEVYDSSSGQTKLFNFTARLVINSTCILVMLNTIETDTIYHMFGIFDLAWNYVKNTFPQMNPASEVYISNPYLIFYSPDSFVSYTYDLNNANFVTYDLSSQLFKVDAFNHYGKHLIGVAQNKVNPYLNDLFDFDLENGTLTQKNIVNTVNNERINEMYHDVFNNEMFYFRINLQSGISSQIWSYNATNRVLTSWTSLDLTSPLSTLTTAKSYNGVFVQTDLNLMIAYQVNITRLVKRTYDFTVIPAFSAISVQYFETLNDTHLFIWGNTASDEIHYYIYDMQTNTTVVDKLLFSGASGSLAYTSSEDYIHGISVNYLNGSSVVYRFNINPVELTYERIAPQEPNGFIRQYGKSVKTKDHVWDFEVTDPSTLSLKLINSAGFEKYIYFNFHTLGINLVNVVLVSNTVYTIEIHHKETLYSIIAKYDPATQARTILFNSSSIQFLAYNSQLNNNHNLDLMITDTADGQKKIFEWDFNQNTYSLGVVLPNNLTFQTMVNGIFIGTSGSIVAIDTSTSLNTTIDLNGLIATNTSIQTKLSNLVAPATISSTYVFTSKIIASPDISLSSGQLYLSSYASISSSINGTSMPSQLLHVTFVYDMKLGDLILLKNSVFSLNKDSYLVNPIALSDRLLQFNNNESGLFVYESFLDNGNLLKPHLLLKISNSVAFTIQSFSRFAMDQIVFLSLGYNVQLQFINLLPVPDLHPPTISSITEYNIVDPNTSIQINATVSDNVGVNTTILSYSTGNTWTNISMVLVGSNWTGFLTAFANNTIVQYRIFAVDGSNNWAFSAIYNLTVVKYNTPNTTTTTSDTSTSSPPTTTTTSETTNPSDSTSQTLNSSSDKTGTSVNLDFNLGFVILVLFVSPIVLSSRRKLMP